MSHRLFWSFESRTRFTRCFSFCQNFCSFTVRRLCCFDFFVGQVDGPILVLNGEGEKSSGPVNNVVFLEQTAPSYAPEVFCQHIFSRSCHAVALERRYNRLSAFVCYHVDLYPDHDAPGHLWGCAL